MPGCHIRETCFSQEAARIEIMNDSHSGFGLTAYQASILTIKVGMSQNGGVIFQYMFLLLRFAASYGKGHLHCIY